MYCVTYNRVDRLTSRSLFYIANDLFYFRLRPTKTFMYERTRISEYTLLIGLGSLDIFSRVHFIFMTDKATDSLGHTHDYLSKQYSFVY